MTSHERPPWPQIGAPLDDVNAGFHAAYQSSRNVAAVSEPVFVLMDHQLMIAWQHERRSLPVTPRSFHVLKSVAHAPPGAYALLLPLCDQPLSAESQRLIQTMQARIGACQTHLDAELGPADAADAKAVAESSSALLLKVSQQQGITLTELKAFAHHLGPPLLRVTDQATRIQLDALHTAVEQALATLSPSALSQLQVIVVGDHQARERSLAMQYFRKRLAEPAGAEERVAFAEGISDLDEALALVGTRRLDRHLAGAFFGDAKRLQRDVLGDSAKAILDAAHLDSIG